MQVVGYVILIFDIEYCWEFSFFINFCILRFFYRCLMIYQINKISQKYFNEIFIIIYFYFVFRFKNMNFKNGYNKVYFVCDLGI